MRKIKFRIWSKELKRFTPGHQKTNSYDEIYSDGAGLFLGSLRKIQRDKDYIIQQFTGHKDKNGKEVYEGDIVHDRISAMVTDHRMTRYQVTYNETYAAFVLQDIGKGCWNWIRNISSHGKVIGNIFENPELLK